MREKLKKLQDLLDYEILKNPDYLDRLNIKLKKTVRKYAKTLRTCKKSFTSALTHTNSKILFKEVKSLYLPKNNQPETSISCDDFSNYFSDKIINIRSTIPSVTFNFDLSPYETPIPLKIFDLTNENEVTSVLKSSKKTNSPSEIFPSKYYIEFLSTLLPYIVKLINTSFTSGVFPTIFKHAYVRPILKKSNSDPDVPANYRPISLLPFLSKIIERIAATRILKHMEIIKLEDTFQSGFKSKHSTETSLLYLTDQLRRSSDSGKITILINLDLSSAFDTIDPELLLNDLHIHLGLTDTALQWFKSYLSDRVQTIKIGDSKSSPKKAPFGVPQGSVDGPHLFRIYLIPLLILLKKLGLKFSIFADDSGIYICCSPSSFIETV